MLTSVHQTEHLRILATSDVHMNIVSFDYFSDAPAFGAGLSSLSNTIADLRRTAIAEDPPRRTLLLDNGDMLQGTPLGTYLAGLEADSTPHPVAQVMNDLGYDAMGVGNHDLDYGIGYLGRFATSLDAPLVSSNLHLQDPRNWLVPHALLKLGQLTVGIISVLPPRTVEWSYARLGGAISIDDMLIAAKAAATEVRDAGADLVVALAHTGIGTKEGEDALDDLAACGDIDALIGGHIHKVFPSADFQDHGPANLAEGTLHGVPTVMPGFSGAFLGCIDLDLRQDRAGAWVLERGSGWIAPARKTGQVISQPVAAVEEAHTATRRDLDRVVGEAPTALVTYFAQVQPTDVMAVLAAAQADAIDKVRQGTPFEALPLLSVVSPTRCGGRGGSWNYTDIPQGVVSGRDLAQLTLFTNLVWAVDVTGAELAAWLEKSASQFALVDPVTPGPLIHNDAPSFDFDIIHGVSFEIDPTRPSPYHTSPEIAAHPQTRIKNLSYKGAPIDEDSRFLLAVNSYRACGGGRFPNLSPDRAVLRPGLSAKDVLHDYIAGNHPPPEKAAWSFATEAKGAKCWLDTGPGALTYLDHIAAFKPGVPQLQSSGFVRIPLTL